METKIRWWLLGIAAVALLAVGAYIGWFTGHLGRGFADEPEQWGQFGDYLGGFLNPLIAAAAFYWLTQSVRIQHTELRATRDALAETAAAQERTAVAQAEQVRLAALAGQLNVEAALLQATDIEMGALRERLSRMEVCMLDRRNYYEVDGNVVGPDHLRERIRFVGAQVADAYRERLATIERIALIRQQMELAPAFAPDAPAANPRQT